MVILHCGLLLETSCGKIRCQSIYFHSEKHIRCWNNHQFCWCLHREYLSCSKVLSDHFCYEKKWQDICTLKASEFIRLWFLAYLWSSPKAYCLFVPLQLKCSYPVSQSVYGRKHFYFLARPMLLRIVGLSIPSRHPQATSLQAGSCTSDQMNDRRESRNTPWQSSKNQLGLPSHRALLISLPEHLLQLTSTFSALKIHKFKRNKKQKTSSMTIQELLQSIQELGKAM